MSKFIVVDGCTFFTSVYLKVPSIDTSHTVDNVPEAGIAMLLNCGFLNAIFAILKI